MSCPRHSRRSRAPCTAPRCQWRRAPSHPRAGPPAGRWQGGGGEGRREDKVITDARELVSGNGRQKADTLALNDQRQGASQCNMAKRHMHPHSHPRNARTHAYMHTLTPSLLPPLPPGRMAPVLVRHRQPSSRWSVARGRVRHSPLQRARMAQPQNHSSVGALGQRRQSCGRGLEGQKSAPSQPRSSTALHVAVACFGRACDGSVGDPSLATSSDQQPRLRPETPNRLEGDRGLARLPAVMKKGT